MFIESIKMAFSNLWHNKMRTFLTVLGVIIGISSIIALMTLVQGATDSVSSNLVSAGANKINVMIIGDINKTGLTDNDIDIIKDIDNVDYIAVNITSKSTIVAGETADDGISVYGIDENYFRSSSDALYEGRFINQSDIDNQTNVCMITSDMAKDYFGKMSALGQTVKVKGISFTVVGVLNSSSTSIMLSDVVCVPYSTATNTLNMGQIRGFDMYVKDTGISASTQENLKNTLLQMFNNNENAYTVFDMQVFMDMFDQIMGTMTGLLTGIAAISLLVGGIGIMNMMLVSVSERTNEIGLRKALGAKPSIILLQFILEAVFISLIGGILGFAFGVSISTLAGQLLSVTPSITLDIVTLAIGFSAAVGLVFGIVPARRASKLNPIDALRSN